jgi:hypothetical protein
LFDEVRLDLLKLMTNSVNLFRAIVAL